MTSTINSIMNTLALVAMAGTLIMVIRDRNRDAIFGYAIALIWFLLYMLEKYLGASA